MAVYGFVFGSKFRFSAKLDFTEKRMLSVVCCNLSTDGILYSRVMLPLSSHFVRTSLLL